MSAAKARRSREAGDRRADGQGTAQPEERPAEFRYRRFRLRGVEGLLRNVFSKHSAVIAAFDREFIVTGQLPERHAAALRDAFEQRLIGDYEYLESFPQRRARAVLEAAEAFVSDGEAFLRREAGG